MSETLHPAASHHLPSFITAPGETDILMVVMAVILILAVLGFGILYLRLHTLPERIAHRGHKLQFEIAGLLLALIDLPDIGGWLNRIGTAVEKIAGVKPDQKETSAESSGTEERAAQVPKRAAVKPKELYHA